MKSVQELKKYVGSREKIIYEGNQDFRCLIFETIFNSNLPLAIIWGAIDSIILLVLNSTTVVNGGSGVFFMISIFILVHMMPVWLYLFGIFTAIFKYRNIAYIVTDKAIYYSEGVIHKYYYAKPYYEPSYITIHKGLFDKMFGVGDIIVTSSNSLKNYNMPVDVYNDLSIVPIVTIHNVKNYEEIYQCIRQYQEKEISSMKNNK